MPSVRITVETILKCSNCNNEDFDCVGFGDYKTTGPGHYKTQMNYQCSKCKHVSLV